MSKATLYRETVETISSDLLILWGGVFKTFLKDEVIFHEGQQPHFFHQVQEGRVKMVNTSDEGKEFIQGFFAAGQSFGEPPLFIRKPYPASAVAATACVVLRLHVSTFLQLLKENFQVHYKITGLLAQRVCHKSNLLKEISVHNPTHRILSILNNYKEEHLAECIDGEKIKVDFTRQQIADMSGLRVETVIRTMRHLQEEQKLVIEKGKVFY